MSSIKSINITCKWIEKIKHTIFSNKEIKRTFSSNTGNMKKNNLPKCLLFSIKFSKI